MHRAGGICTVMIGNDPPGYAQGLSFRPEWRPAFSSVASARRAAMKWRNPSAGFGLVAAVALLVVVWCAIGPSKATAQSKPEPKTGRLTIVVTGGDGNKPVAEASVYLKYTVPGKHGGGKKFELNLKTNQEGEAHSPEIPQGEVLVQIVVPNWKTFGQYYELQEDDQTIQIHLDRPNSKFY